MKINSLKKCILLAPTKPIALQHYQEMIEEYPDLTIIQAIGKLNSTTIQKIESKEYHVIIGTPGVISNLISKQILPNDICLVVFDEVHHATKKHKYNDIAKQFLIQDIRIIGLSAFLVKRNTSTSSAEGDVKKLLHSLKAISLNPPLELIQNFKSNPDEVLVEVKRQQEKTEEYTEQVERVLEKYSEEDEKYDEMQRLCKKLGPGYIQYLQNKEQNAEFNFIQLKYLSSHVDQIIKLVLQHIQTPQDRGIIFVKRIKHVEHMQMLLQAIFDQLGIQIKVQKIVGQASMRTREVKQILNSFKQGEFQLLVASSVAEEGIDIQQCNFIIVQFNLETARRYIQTKGRARKQNSKYYVLATVNQKGSIKQKNYLKIKEQSEQFSQTTCMSVLYDAQSDIQYRYENSLKEVKIPLNTQISKEQIINQNPLMLERQAQNIFFSQFFAIQDPQNQSYIYLSENIPQTKTPYFYSLKFMQSVIQENQNPEIDDNMMIQLSEGQFQVLIQFNIVMNQFLEQLNIASIKDFYYPKFYSCVVQVANEFEEVRNQLRIPNFQMYYEKAVQQSQNFTNEEGE